MQKWLFSVSGREMLLTSVFLSSVYLFAGLFISGLIFIQNELSWREKIIKAACVHVAKGEANKITKILERGVRSSDRLLECLGLDLSV